MKRIKHFFPIEAVPTVPSRFSNRRGQPRVVPHREPGTKQVLKETTLVRRFILGIALFLVVTSHSVFADYETGMEALKAGDFLNASQQFIEAAENEDPNAQMALGFMYSAGAGLLTDETKAVFWYQKAAEQGVPEAQYEIAEHYEEGWGVRKDYSLAIEWYLKSAEQGHAPAQNNVGNLYIWGKGTKRDYANARKWYLKGAMQGHAYAQRNVGSIYGHGQGVAKDLIEAFAWATLAADNGNSKAQQDLQWLNGQLSDAQVNEGRKRSEALSQKISVQKTSQSQRDQVLENIWSGQIECAPIPISNENQTLHFKGFTISYGEGKTWCSGGPPEPDMNRLSYVMHEMDNGLALIRLSNLEDRRFSSPKQLLKFAKNTKLANVFEGSGKLVGKSKYSIDKSLGSICVRHKRVIKPGFFDSLVVPMAILGFRSHVFGSKGHAIGHGFNCVHPNSPSVLVYAEILKGMNRRPTEVEKERMAADAREFFQSIAFTPLE